MEIENLDNDNVPGIWVSVYEITGIAIKATFGIWDTPAARASTQRSLDHDLPVGGDDWISIFHGGLHTDGDGLLTRVQMAKTTNHFLFVQIAGRRLHSSVGCE